VVPMLILAGVAGVLAIATIPLLLPWPQHLRWLIASMAAPDPVAMSVGTCPLLMCEVAVRDVHRSAGWITVQLVGISPSRSSSSYALSVDATGPDVAARLERWSLAQTPLLFVDDAHGAVSLHGPSHSVVGLEPLPSRSGSSVSRSAPLVPR